MAQRRPPAMSAARRPVRESRRLGLHERETASDGRRGPVLEDRL